MCTGREGFDVWWKLKSQWRNDLLSVKWWRRAYRSGYLWEDSVYTYWNRLIGCRGKHKSPTLLDEECNGESVAYCFACKRRIAA